MRPMEFLHNWLSKSLNNLHSRTLSSLINAVDASIKARQLTLSSIARASDGGAKIKNKIKQMDRLLGNKKVTRQINDFYASMAAQVIKNNKNPLILVDWATVDERNTFHVLKAAVAYNGRALTIFDHVERRDRKPSKKNNSLDKFLSSLAAVIPAGCKPIIVTDAGFSAKWFKRVESFGWYWVGRIRGLTSIRLDGLDRVGCKSVFHLATSKPKNLGEATLSKKNSLHCKLVLYKSTKKNRQKLGKYGQKLTHCVKAGHAKAATEPWLLATNIPKEMFNPTNIVRCYKQRMQIEETFRDIKCKKTGLGIIDTRSTTKERIAILLLIAMLALYVTGMVGKFAYQQNIHLDFQAHSNKNRKSMSLWFLGRQIYNSNNYQNVDPPTIYECLAINFHEGVQDYAQW